MSEIQELEELIMGTSKVVGYHKLRTRKAGSTRQIDYHLIVPSDISVLEAHNIAQEIENKMKVKLTDATVVTHIEPDTIDMTIEPNTEIRRRDFRRVHFHGKRFHRRKR